MLTDRYISHCEYCNTPIELWEPLKSYPTDRSCEVFDDFFNIIAKLEGLPRYTYEDVLKRCEGFRDKYPDMASVEDTVQELISIQLDLGVIPDKYKPMHLVK